jgi:hypothetical protein
MENTPKNLLLNDTSFIDLLVCYIEQNTQLEKYFSGENKDFEPLILKESSKLLNQKMLEQLQLYYKNNIIQFEFNQSILENYKSIEPGILSLKKQKDLAVQAQKYELAANYRFYEKQLITSTEIEPIIESLNNTITDKLANADDAQTYFGHGTTILNFLNEYHSKTINELTIQLQLISIKQLLTDISLELNFCNEEEFDYAKHLIAKRKSKWLRSILIN